MPGPGTAEPVRHVVFRAAGERFALPLSAVREVVVPRAPFARVPRSGPAVRGAMTLRGRVVALVDLAALAGVGTQPLAAGSGQVVILDRDRRALGLLVSQVLGVEALSLEVVDTRGGLMRGLGQMGGGAVALLDPEAVAAQAAAQFGAA